MNNRPKLIAFYLPQYHPIPENDQWWGPGFTEWTNVTQAKPLFRGHIQPKIPRDLGFYDLRVPETRIAQAKLAKRAGIEGFCYWHYWFGDGRRLLERPFEEVLQSGQPDYPFCLGWANHTWFKKTWSANDKSTILIEQKYPGESDIINHFNTMLPAFKDHRYMRIDNRLIFLIWDALHFKYGSSFFDKWNELAKQNGLPNFYFIGFSYNKEYEKDILSKGFNAVCLDVMQECYQTKSNTFKIFRKIRNLIGITTPKVFNYNLYSNICIKIFEKSSNQLIPCVLPNWDHSPRSKQNAIIFKGCSPNKFISLLKKIVEIQQNKKSEINNVVFIKSWNEWGEGNYLEPDYENGTAYIDSLSSFIKQYTM